MHGPVACNRRPSVCNMRRAGVDSQGGHGWGMRCLTQQCVLFSLLHAQPAVSPRLHTAVQLFPEECGFTEALSSMSSTGMRAQMCDTWPASAVRRHEAR